jgi:hypothetical protein
LGAVLDVYWHFASIGDHYLGRILAGLDPNTPDFGTLPPHWTTSNPLENNLIKRAMVMLYGPILVAYEGKPENPAGLLLRCLSSLVFHSDALLEVMVKFPGHDFTKISILHDRELLDGLKKLVTTVLEAPRMDPQSWPEEPQDCNQAAQECTAEQDKEVQWRSL